MGGSSSLNNSPYTQKMGNTPQKMSSTPQKGPSQQKAAPGQGLGVYGVQAGKNAGGKSAFAGGGGQYGGDQFGGGGGQFGGGDILQHAKNARRFAEKIVFNPQPTSRPKFASIRQQQPGFQTGLPN